MPTTLPARPSRTLTSPEGVSFPYYVIPFSREGVCEGPKTRTHLLENLAGVTDIFVFSHGWRSLLGSTIVRRLVGASEPRTCPEHRELAARHGLELRPTMLGMFAHLLEHNATCNTR